MLLLLASGEATTVGRTAARGCRELKLTNKSAAAVALSWVTPATEDDRAKLDKWCDTVGPALFRSPVGSAQVRKGRVIVVDWNVHLGNGNIAALIDELKENEHHAGRDEPHFVFLLQEAFRRGTDLPSEIPDGVNVPGRISPSTNDDIEALAKRLDWWMFYVPSMRNGEQPDDAAEDRGNAILSSLPLESLAAIELPFSVQRRVAVSAIVQDRDRALRFRVMAAHLDTRAPLHRGFIFGASAERNRQAKWLADAVNGPADEGLSLIVGADMNTYWGAFESSVDTIARIAPRVDCGKDGTHSTGFKLDHLFARLYLPWTSMSCARPKNRFGSDHHPLVLSIDADLR